MKAGIGDVMEVVNEDEMYTIQYDHLVCDLVISWSLWIDGREILLPKSICAIDEDELTIQVPEWLMEKEGLESYIVD